LSVIGVTLKLGLLCTVGACRYRERRQRNIT